ncbi:MAG: MipA/OmpV family protein [Thiolinea sp.]
MNKNRLLFNATLITLLSCSQLQAEATKKGRFGLGVSTSNRFSVYQGADNEFEIHPHLQYRGERFNILGDTMGYNFSNSGNLRFEVIGKAINRGYDAKHLTELKGMADRDPGFDAGGRAALQTDMGMFSIDATTDISSTHKGQTVDIRFGPDIYKQHWDGQREVSLNMLAGAKWESDKVVDYYYGVRNNETNSERTAYKGQSALTPYVGLDAQLRLSKNITVDGQVIYQKLPGEIANSPIVEDDQMVNAGVGLTYWFD